jgi:hypothetical protein
MARWSFFVGPAQDLHTPRPWTLTDIAAKVRKLQARGIAFQTYDYPGNTWDGVIADNGMRRSAWFKDSEGNLLNVVQLLKQTT